MRTFLSLLKEESDDSKLKHITHVEDHILHDGKEGYEHSVGVLNKVRNHIKSGKMDPTLTMKHDGSPSIVYGHHPETGKFFVASKSAFNVNPKINYTEDDIERNHGHAPGLVEKLKHALHHLPKVAPKTGVYQGDMMFSGSDKTEHDGKVHFKPNTIMYSAPKDSEEGKKIRKAKVGLYTHTQYHGKDLASMKADFNPDLSGFKNSPDVYHRTPGHDTSKVQLTKHDEEQLDHHLAQAHAIHTVHGDKMYDATEIHRNPGGPIESHINSTIRTGETPSVEGLKKHLLDKFNKDIDKLKTPAARARKEAERDTHIAHIEKNKDHYENLLKLHHHLQKAKDVLVHALARHTGGLEHSVGDAQVKPEGFVATHKGRVSKLNDRQEFNRLNFLARPR
jgi:hypothetical protein